MESLEAAKNVKVLMYHRVLNERPPKSSPWHYVTTKEFEQQMSWLDRLGFNTITFEDYCLYLDGKLTLPKKSVIITFDDGYLDTYTNAIPIMLKYNMKGVIYVMGNRNLSSAEWEESHEKNLCLLMSDDQVREADSYGFEIGAHSYDHLDLLKLNQSEVRDEARRSRESLNKILNKSVLSFAYPYGRVDYKTQEIIKKEGFKFACGVYTGPPKFTGNRFDIRRLAIEQGVNLLSFLTMILAPVPYVYWLYNEIKNLSSRKNDLELIERPQKEVNKQSPIVN